MIVAKYKFNPSTYADYIPVFNDGFTDYTTSDTTNSDGTITRTIESSSLPTLMRFGEISDTTDRSRSLLEILDMNISNLTIMSHMFRYCENLTSIVYNWNTSKVTNMESAFRNCSSLTSLDVSNWDTSKVTNMDSAFRNCSSLTTLDVSNWDTSKVTNMKYMFVDCRLLTSLDVSNWDTSKVANMTYMFDTCEVLTSLDVSNWNTSKVTDMAYMFYNCFSLTSLDVSNWDTSKVANMSNMFHACNLLTTLDLSNWNTSNVTDMYKLFRNCKQLTSLNLSNFNIGKVINMGHMFFNCSSLTSLDVSNWDTSKVTKMESMFEGCSSLRKVNLKYANQSTVSKIHENLPDRSSTTEGYILSLLDLTSDKNWEVLKFSQNEVYLPQPLRKVGDVKDRFYWDYDKGHYCIEQNISKSYVDVSTYTPYDLIIHDDYIQFNMHISILPNENHYRTDYESIAPISNTLLGCNRFAHINMVANSFSIMSAVRFKIMTKYLISCDKEGIIQWFTDNPTYIYYISTPVIIDLPHLNQKFSFDTYLPNTSVDVTNLLLQPYKLLLEDDTVRYKSTIEPSTLYTIQFNCLAKSTTNLTLDLGGTRVTVEPIIGVNHVQITTPSELTSDRLFLIGTGIVIKEVIVNKGNMNQYTKYFDGEQSVGELQTDGSYIIRISTDNYTGLWEGDL